MNNQDIFNDFDMVVAMTQKTINDQLTHLTRLGAINSELIITQTYDEATEKAIYTILSSKSDLPKKPDGNVDEEKLDAYLQGTLKPQLHIYQSGTVAMLVLNFLDGTFGYYAGGGRHPIWKTVDMRGWFFGISVNLDLAGLARDDINQKIAVPSEVEKQLTNFMDNMFTVNHLFMDFESTDLINFDPTITSVGDAGDEVKKEFVFFMQEYLKAQKNGKNPYILGYVMSATEQTNYSSYGNVPDSLRPVGTTYNLFKDTAYPDLSTLNFVLVTKGGHQVISSTPANFDGNWITSNEQCDAKMIYGHEVLIERYILMPVFHQIRDGIFDQIKDHLSVEIGNDYEHARYKTTNGFEYKISNKNDGDDHYVNHYSVEILNHATDSRVDITFHGHLEFYKRHSENKVVCTAVKEAWTKLDWDIPISLSLSKDTNGRPNVSMSKGALRMSNSEHGTKENDCSKAIKWISIIISAILLNIINPASIITLIGSIFELVMEEKDILVLGNVLGDISGTVNTVLLLPGGDVFFLKNPTADSVGNFYLELTYKSEH